MISGDDLLDLTSPVESRARDYQRSRVYRWERSLNLNGKRHRDPIKARGERVPPEFRAFFDEVWRWCTGRYFIAFNCEPALRISFRLRSTSGYAGRVPIGRGRWRYGIVMQWPDQRVLLHEIAHLVALRDKHGPNFCRAVLDLYVRFLGVDEAKALRLAEQHRVRVAERYTA